MDNMKLQYCHSVYPRFEDTDAYGILHHSRYLTYIEEAKIAFFNDERYFGENIIDEEQGKFPVLDLSVKYIKAVHYRASTPIEVRLEFYVVEGLMVKFDFQLYYQGVKVVKGHISHVYMDANEQLRYSMPDRIVKRYQELVGAIEEDKKSDNEKGCEGCQIK